LGVVLIFTRGELVHLRGKIRTVNVRSEYLHRSDIPYPGITESNPFFSAEKQKIPEMCIFYLGLSTVCFGNGISQSKPASKNLFIWLFP